ncbi:MAG: sulfurtransferase TusA family protein [Xanthobacteraceae bacterium]
MTLPTALAILRRMSLTKLDLIGLKCPQPVLRTRKALKSLAPGDRLEVHCSDPLAAIDIPHLIAQTGDRVETMQRQDTTTVFLIEKSGAAAPKSCD